jgi:transposase
MTKPKHPDDLLQRGRHTKYTPDMCDKVVELGKIGASKTETCAKLGISFDSYQTYQREYPEFLESVKEADLFYQCFWEEAMRDAALGINPNANPTLMIFNMKNRFRKAQEAWTDKSETELTGKDGSDLIPSGINITFVNGKE